MSSPVAAPELEARLGALGGVVAYTDLHGRRGRVSDLIGLIVEATGLEAEVGQVCLVDAGRAREPVPAEVVGFRSGRTLLMPLGDLQGLAPGHAVVATGRPVSVPVGPELLGRVLDGLGRPLEGGPPAARERRAIEASPPDPLQRTRITEQVTKFIIQLLETVNVQHDERERAVVTRAALDLLQNPLLEIAAVVNAGQPVNVCEVARALEMPCILDGVAADIGNCLQSLHVTIIKGPRLG